MMILTKQRLPKEHSMIMGETWEGEFFFALYVGDGDFHLSDGYNGLTGMCIKKDNVRSWMYVKDLKNLLGVR